MQTKVRHSRFIHIPAQHGIFYYYCYCTAVESSFFGGGGGGGAVVALMVVRTAGGSGDWDICIIHLPHCLDKSVMVSTGRKGVGVKCSPFEQPWSCSRAPVSRTGCCINVIPTVLPHAHGQNSSQGGLLLVLREPLAAHEHCELTRTGRTE